MAIGTAISKMSAAEHDHLVEAYASGHDLTSDQVDYLRTYTPTAVWFDIEKRRASSVRKPMIDALKAQFPEGSLVRLKSGSPAMTVEWSRDDGIIAVTWFDGNICHRDGFHPDCLIENQPIRLAPYEFKAGSVDWMA